MSSFPLVIAFVSVALVAAACGGKSKGAAPAGGPAEGDDSATPFNDGAVKAALAGAPGVSACGMEASTTMGVHFAAQRDALKSGGHAVTESFACRAQGDNTWECTWSVFTNPAESEPEDPCAWDGAGSGYQIIATVGNDGRIAADKILCNAPG